jgi:hypothetical protein
MPQKGVDVIVNGFGLVKETKPFLLVVKQDGFQEWAVYRDYEAFQTLEFQVRYC